jgi:transposase
MKTIMIGLDLAKSVFQVHGIDDAGQVVMRRRLQRGQVLGFFAKLAPALVGMEACSGAHYWARQLGALGHAIRMMPPGYVKPYVKRNKTDGRDAEAICEAMQRPTMRFVAVKSPQQQAVMSVHRSRALLVRQRTMVANALRSACAEFGVVAAHGRRGLGQLMQALAVSDGPIPAPARAALLLLTDQWQALEVAVGRLEAQILCQARSDAAARRLMAIPGVGPITASLITASVADAHLFRSARNFAAWLGLTPRQHSSAGKQRSGGISKQGDRTIRSLLILGATARLRHERARGVKDVWLAKLIARRPVKVAAVALAAKTARIIWALLAKGESYRAPAQLAA